MNVCVGIKGFHLLAFHLFKFGYRKKRQEQAPCLNQDDSQWRIYFIYFRGHLRNKNSQSKLAFGAVTFNLLLCLCAVAHYRLTVLSIGFLTNQGVP